MADAVEGRHLEVTLNERTCTPVASATSGRGSAVSRPVAWPLLVVLALVPLVFLGIFFAWPVAAMAWRGISGDGGLDLAGAWQVLTRPRTLRVLWFTLWMAALATACSVALGLPVAHALYRLRVPLAGVWRAVVVLPFVLPTVVVGVAFRSLFAAGGLLEGLGWDGTWQPVLLAMVFFNVSVVVRTVGPMWASLDPRTGQAAAGLGASPVEVFRTVTWPAIRPAVVSAATVVFLFCSTAFGIVLMLGGLRYATLETEIYSLTVDFLDLRAAAVLSTVQFVLVALLLFAAERARTGLRRNDVVVRRGVAVADEPRRITRADAPALAVTVLVLLLVLTPLITLVVRSVRDNDGWSLTHYRALGGELDALGALNMSWRIALDAALLALVLGVCVAVVVAWRAATPRGRRIVAALDGVFMLPLGVSAVTVGFGFLLTLDRPPLDLRSSPVLIPIAQATVALPLVVRTLVPVLRSLDPRAREAASALGAGPVRAWMTADLPHLWRPFVAAAGFALAVSLGEFGATAFLAQPESPTLPVLIYQLLGRPGAGNFGAAMAASVVLAAATALVMAGVERIGGAAAGRMDR